MGTSIQTTLICVKTLSSFRSACLLHWPTLTFYAACIIHVMVITLFKWWLPHYIPRNQKQNTPGQLLRQGCLWWADSNHIFKNETFTPYLQWTCAALNSNDKNWRTELPTQGTSTNIAITKQHQMPCGGRANILTADEVKI